MERKRRFPWEVDWWTVGAGCWESLDSSYSHIIHSHLCLGISSSPPHKADSSLMSRSKHRQGLPSVERVTVPIDELGVFNLPHWRTHSRGSIWRTLFPLCQPTLATQAGSQSQPSPVSWVFQYRKGLHLAFVRFYFLLSLFFCSALVCVQSQLTL